VSDFVSKLTDRAFGVLRSDAAKPNLAIEHSWTIFHYAITTYVGFRMLTASLILLLLVAWELRLRIWLGRAVCIRARRSGWILIEVWRRSNRCAHGGEHRLAAENFKSEQSGETETKICIDYTRELDASHDGTMTTQAEVQHMLELPPDPGLHGFNGLKRMLDLLYRIITFPVAAAQFRKGEVAPHRSTDGSSSNASMVAEASEPGKSAHCCPTRSNVRPTNCRTSTHSLRSSKLSRCGAHARPVPITATRSLGLELIIGRPVI
jgi:hypothetical protein